MIGSLIGAGIGAIGSIFGGISAAKKMREVQKSIENQQKQNQDWYDRRYNEDATQRADAQRVLTMTEEAIKKRNQQAAGAAAVMGGSQEALAAAREQNAQAMADAASQIAVAGERRKDQIENQFLSRRENLENQLNELRRAQAQNTAQAIQGVTKAAGGIGSMFG